MDNRRFDRLSRSVAVRTSRRRLLAGSGFGLLGLGRGLTTAAPAAAACKPNGATCKLENPLACCSGVCKKRPGEPARCAVNRNAFGCTVDDDFCRLGNGREKPCPKRPGGICFRGGKGRPLCAKDGFCVLDCESCLPGFSCVKCPVCKTLGQGDLVGCVRPFPT